jgi:two-component system alkaline phosphatase synthesis response regulator PhoP
MTTLPTTTADPNPQRPIRVLIVEDQTKIAYWLAGFLRQAAFEPIVATDGATGIRLAHTESPDVIILDLMLPDMDGLEVCRTIRRESDVFILMLTARVEEADRLLGLESGADDYIIKPFSAREVVARIRALLRRASGTLGAAENNGSIHAPPAKILICGNLTLDLTRRQCTLGDDSITLTPTEFALLSTLMRQPGVPFTRERLINEALGYDYGGYERTIDVHIRNLRRKIEADLQTPRFILTVFGVGYRFAES